MHIEESKKAQDQNTEQYDEWWRIIILSQPKIRAANSLLNFMKVWKIYFCFKAKRNYKMHGFADFQPFNDV